MRIDEMAAFMRERHNIYLKRKMGQRGPWTRDDVLNTYRFCNIFRELDTVTIWIRKNIRERYADHPRLWLMLAIARYINWPDTLQEIMDGPGFGWPSFDSWEPKHLTAALEARAARGDKVYTGAYMIRAESDPNAPWYSWTKHRYISEIVIGRLWEDREMWEDFLDNHVLGGLLPLGGFRLESVWSLFQNKRYIGWGPFMAYEVVTDMRHTRYLRDAPDIMTWANAGPGALRGLNRLHERELNQRLSPMDATEEMRYILGVLNSRPDLWPEKFPRLEMRDVEHTLCEFDKYLRVKAGEGRPRAKYDWKHGTTLD